MVGRTHMRYCRRPGLAPSLFVLVLLAGSSSATEIVCHRGANRHAPENTYASTQLCIDWGVDYVEIDVRRSSDGVMFVIHDARVDRTTDGSGYVNQLESLRIEQLDAGSWFGAEYEGEPVPRLEAFLRWIDGRIKVYLDVKDADESALIDLVRRAGMEDQCFFWFSDNDQARRFRELAPDLELKINAATAEQVELAVREYQADIIEVRLRNLTPDFAEACRSHGLEIMVYEPLADREAFRRIVELGADKVNLNDGDLFQEVQREIRAAAMPAETGP